MGYCMHQREAMFCIPAEKIPGALKAVQELHGKESIRGEGDFHFSWVDDDFHLRTDFVEIMRAWRYEVDVARDITGWGWSDGGKSIECSPGSICHIEFEGEKLGDDQTLFNALAPFVAKGSYIEMQGEEGALWRWVFDGEQMVEQHANITWD